ncbi:hypothetical protein E2C01_065295 [Portunus trituberculatus]|uniref:Uncharacterized protein n=1 Tax=Portunus trituberculatus TaxID=210409 RepID=A0A5B7HML6_PORTR|nr:hypothetical protein [Portunus trituberculatus]
MSGRLTSHALAIPTISVYRRTRAVTGNLLGSSDVVLTCPPKWKLFYLIQVQHSTPVRGSDY